MNAEPAEIQQQLEARLDPTVRHTLHGTVRLCWSSTAEQFVTFSLYDGEFTWVDRDASADVTFYFDDQQQMLDVLYGAEDPIAAFMRGSFRSSGYLVWTFPLLTLFRGTPIP